MFILWIAGCLFNFISELQTRFKSEPQFELKLPLNAQHVTIRCYRFQVTAFFLLSLSIVNYGNYGIYLRFCWCG